MRKFYKQENKHLYGLGKILYSLNGKEDIMYISCMYNEDNEDTLKAHLLKWYPNAEFIGAIIEPIVKKD